MYKNYHNIKARIIVQWVVQMPFMFIDPCFIPMTLSATPTLPKVIFFGM